jgi:imidazolonepropionase-like amidohydrolase
VIEDGVVKEVTHRPISSASTTRIDLRGRTLMPGLIDAHIHIALTEVNLRLLADVPLTLLAAKGSVAMRAMLHRGFTTLRDTGGGAHADLLVVDGDPYRDISLFQDGGRNLAAIMLGGRFVRNMV